MLKLNGGIFIFILVCMTPSAHAFEKAPSFKLKQAVHAYQGGTYKQCISQIETLVSNLELDETEDIVAAYTYLGAAYFQNGNLQKAQLAFGTLKRFLPSASLDKRAFSPQMRRFFASVRSPYQDTMDLAETNTQVPYSTEKKHNEISSFTEKNPIVEETLKTEFNKKDLHFDRFIPFGYGQFQNNQIRKGRILFASQTTALAAATVSAMLFNFSQNRDGTFSNPGTAKGFRMSFLISGSVFLGLLTGGVIDAFLNIPDPSRAHDFMAQY